MHFNVNIKKKIAIFRRTRHTVPHVSASYFSCIYTT